MSKIFVVYGHHNLEKSFNQEIRDTFCSEAKKLGHEIDLINLHGERHIPFYDGTKPVSYTHLTLPTNREV